MTPIYQHVSSLKWTSTHNTPPTVSYGCCLSDTVCWWSPPTCISSVHFLSASCTSAFYWHTSSVAFTVRCFNLVQLNTQTLMIFWVRGSDFPFLNIVGGLFFQLVQRQHLCKEYKIKSMVWGWFSPRKSTVSWVKAADGRQTHKENSESCTHH